MQRLKKVAALMASLAIMAAVPAGAAAKITEEPVSCTNPAGKQPGGQQPECEGNAHEQETENQNPSGHAPPGQNK